MSLRGSWRFVETPDHDMVGPAYIDLPRAGGELALGCLTGFCHGNDELEPASGTDRLDLQDDGSIDGELSLNNGDDIEFIARRAPSSTACSMSYRQCGQLAARRG